MNARPDFLSPTQSQIFSLAVCRAANELLQLQDEARLLGVDVEVYRRMRELFGKRVREIWIRDVVNDQEVNSFRLNGVDTIIKAEKIVCPTDEHNEKLAVII